MPTQRPLLAELSTTEIAYLVRQKHETVRRKLAEAGLAPVRTDGRTVYFDPRDALPLLFGVGDGLNPQAERARFDRARAELAEHQLAERRGEYIAGAEVDTWRSASSMLVAEDFELIDRTRGPARTTSRIRVAGGSRARRAAGVFGSSPQHERPVGDSCLSPCACPPAQG